jgi:N-acetylglucosaminyldiphosphoundecaprenol N-acetyl-beta-D-mannosaminyltransferase
MEARDDLAMRKVIDEADLVTPDGMPLLWMLRIKGHRLPDRVYGPALMNHLLKSAAHEGTAIGFYGATTATVHLLTRNALDQFPGLHIAFQHSPPFRDLSADEDDQVCRQIDAAGVRLLFVGLGCPRQERWMAAHRGRLRVVMVGVGAAFDYLAGTKKQADAWMQGLGLEWLFRLAHEPRRLGKRYLYHNPRFVALALAELLGVWRP